MPVKTPTQKCLAIMAAADTSGAAGTLIVKTSQELSMQNNRLYRQAMNYKVSFSLIGINALHDDNEVQYDFFTLPNNWFTHGAIRYAFRTYMQAHQDELNAGVRFARWHDFTIDEQNPDGTWELSQSTNYDGDGWGVTLGTAGESPQDSSITLNDGSTVKQFRLMGTDSGAFNIFREYAKLLKYRQPTDTSVSSDQPYDGLLDLKDADKMAEIGDKAPYDTDYSIWLDDGTDDQNILCYQDSISADRNTYFKGRTRTFTAPLGLVWVRKVVDDAAADVSNTSPELCLHVSPGKYKGVHAESIV